MLVVGLTGGLASGKSTVAALFRKWGAKVIDADKLVHQLIAPGGKCYQSILRAFGNEILNGRRIDRPKLAAVVFSERRKLGQLERILHPHVRKLRREQIKKYRKDRRVKVVIVDIPLLFETNQTKGLDYIIVVKADRKTQIRRAQKKLNISATQALRRISRQMPLRKKAAQADFCIDNNGTKQQTIKQARALWQNICRKITNKGK